MRNAEWGRCFAMGRLITPLRRRRSILPDAVPGLQLWLRADAGVYQDSAGTTPAAADGDPVGRWADQSGNGKHATQGTAAKRPTWKTNQLNGLPSVRGDGVDDHLRSTLDLTGVSVCRIFAVYRSVAHVPGAALYGIMADGGAMFVDIQVSDDVDRVGQNTNAADFTYAAFDPAAFAVHVYKHVNASAAGFACRVDRTDRSLAVSGSPANRTWSANFDLFALANGGQNFSNLDVCELMVYDSAVDDYVGGLEQYLKRWGV